MAPDFFIGCAAKEKELAVGGAEGCGSSPHPVWEIEKDEEMDEGNDQVFTPAFGLEVGPKGKKVGIFPLGKTDGMAEGDVRESGVGIDKNQEFPLGLPGQLVAGPGLAGPSFGKFFSGNQTNPRITLGSLANNLGCLVGGVVVEDEHFEIWVIAAD